MASLRIVHVTPPPGPTAVITEAREAEFRRVFGQDIEVVQVSHVGKAPEELIRRLRDISPDAIVLASAPPSHRQAVMGLARETLILRPVREEYRTRRGERQWRVAGFGVMRAGGPVLVADGALAERSAIAQELMIQRSLQPDEWEQ
ncbi:MAG: hypothetical protein ACRDYX_23365 [Egibacteraceae bacterium]